jgi:hypothetical protein
MLKAVIRHTSVPDGAVLKCREDFQPLQDSPYPMATGNPRTMFVYKKGTRARAADSAAPAEKFHDYLDDLLAECFAENDDPDIRPVGVGDAETQFERRDRQRTRANVIERLQQRIEEETSPSERKYLRERLAFIIGQERPDMQADDDAEPFSNPPESAPVPHYNGYQDRTWSRTGDRSEFYSAIQRAADVRLHGGSVDAPRDGRLGDIRAHSETTRDAGRQALGYTLTDIERQAFCRARDMRPDDRRADGYALLEQIYRRRLKGEE